MLWALFRFTKIGLAMRAAAFRPEAARLVGVRVSWMLSLGWGLAAVLGAVAGMMAAASPSVLLQPNMMDGVLIYAFAAAVLGGLESPAGAVVAGLLIGAMLNLLGSYVSWVTPQLLLPAAFVLMLVVLLVKPSGLFGRTQVRAYEGERPALLIGVVAVAVALMPFVLSDYNRSQGADVAVFAMAILGLNVVTGYTGQISIGHGAFMALGGYTTAILTHDHGWNDVATLPVALLVGFVAGVIVGVPALRFHGAYLALLTFAFALAVPQVAKNYSSFTGGTRGPRAPDAHRHVALRRRPGGAPPSSTCSRVFLLRGRTGRAFRAARDSEVAAASSGVSLALYKTFAFGASAAFAAVAGSIYVLDQQFRQPGRLRADVVALHPDRRRRRRAWIAVGDPRRRGVRAAPADRAHQLARDLGGRRPGSLRGNRDRRDGARPSRLGRSASARDGTTKSDPKRVMIRQPPTVWRPDDQ